jgi:hypothetical protein
VAAASQSPENHARLQAIGDIPIAFARERYVVVRSLLPQDVWQELGMHAAETVSSGSITWGDSQVESCPCAYGDPRMESELVRLAPQIEAIAGVKVYPTYSYFRVYLQNASLKRHTDREACELSATICLGGDPWAFWIEGPHGPSSIVLKPGDAILYRGLECPHWRDAFTGSSAIQLFLHYVTRSGPYSAWKFDKRLRPGAPFDDSVD